MHPLQENRSMWALSSKRGFLAITLIGALGAMACSGNGGGAAPPAPNVDAEVDAAAATGADDFEVAAEELSISQNVIAPGEEDATATSSTASPNVADPRYPSCHPHLFERSVEYAWALDYHLYLFLQSIDALLASGPAVKSGTVHQWLYTAPGGLLVQVTLTKTAPGVFLVDESLAPSSSGGTYVSVVSGSIDRSNPSGVTKTLAFDLDALRSVVPPDTVGRLAGKLTVVLERQKDVGGDDLRVTATYTLTDFVPVYGDPNGPRSGSVFFLEDPGVGGAMIYDASVIFLCPANPASVAADAVTYARWYIVTDGSTPMVSGRADARATGGQLAAGDLWVGVSCRLVPLASAEADGADAGALPLEDNGYWMMKVETAEESAVPGTDVGDENPADPPCDPAFGPVPSLTTSASDPSVPSALPSSDAFPGEF
jgi:hypothetical protein